MAIDNTNLNLGICTISWNGIDLGVSEGGVTFNFNCSITDVTNEQAGGALIGQFVHTPRATAEVSIKTASKDLLSQIAPGAVKVGTGTTIRVGLGEGLPKLLDAAQMILHPVSKLASDKSWDTTFPQATIQVSAQQSRTMDGLWLWKMLITALYDTTAAPGKRLVILGDPSIS